MEKSRLKTSHKWYLAPVCTNVFGKISTLYSSNSSKIHFLLSDSDPLRAHLAFFYVSPLRAGCLHGSRTSKNCSNVPMVPLLIPCKSEIKWRTAGRVLRSLRSQNLLRSCDKIVQRAQCSSLLKVCILSVTSVINRVPTFTIFCGLIHQSKRQVLSWWCNGWIIAWCHDAVG